MQRADRMSDRNVREAQRWQAKQTDKAWERTDASALRNRRWALTDYRKTKEDQLNQFANLRIAAKRGGFNPLTVLGMGSMVGPGAGGLSSSSYGASPGVGAAPVSSFSSSVPMAGYGAPVHVPALASNDAISGAIDELGREVTGEAAQERAYDQMAMDIAKIELERARAGLSQPVVPSLAGAGPSLGPQAAPTGNARVSGLGQSMWAPHPNLGWSTSEMPEPWMPSPYDPSRPMEKTPALNAGLFGQIDDKIIRMITGGVPANVMMSPDQEPYFGGAGVALGTIGTAIRNRIVDPWLESTGRDPASWPFTSSGNPNERVFVPRLSKDEFEDSPTAIPRAYVDPFFINSY